MGDWRGRKMICDCISLLSQDATWLPKCLIVTSKKLSASQGKEEGENSTATKYDGLWHIVPWSWVFLEAEYWGNRREGVRMDEWLHNTWASAVREEAILITTRMTWKEKSLSSPISGTPLWPGAAKGTAYLLWMVTSPFYSQDPVFLNGEGIRGMEVCWVSQTD